MLPFLFKVMYNNVKIYKGVSDMVIKLTQVTLYTMYKRIISHDGINKEELKEWEEIYEIYKDIGGNNFIDDLNTQVHKREVL